MSRLSINKIYKLLAVVAVVSVLVPIPYIFTYWLFRGGTFLIIYPLATLLAAFGYGIQAFYGSVISSRVKLRTEYYYESGFESSEKPFKPLHAALPLTIAGIVALISRKIFDRLLFFAAMSDDFWITYNGNFAERLYFNVTRTNEEIPVVYDSNSLYPYIGMLAVFLFIAVGIVLWFYPAHRLISLRTVLSYFGLICVLFAISAMMSVPTTALAASIILFAACAFVVLNQSYIQRSVTGTVTAISNEGRVYNLKLMIFAFSLVIVFLIIFTALFTGITFLVRLLFAYLMVTTFGGSSDPDERYYDADERLDAMSDVLLKNQPIGDKFMIVLCVLLFIGAVIFFIVRGYDSTKKFIAKVKEWLLQIFLFFMDIKNFGGLSVSSDYAYMNYFDEEIKLQDAVIKAYDPSSVKKRSYRDFITHLNSLPTATDQIQYAYVTMLSVFHSLGYGIRPAETPRETNERVNARSVENKIDQITKAVETVDYVEKEPPEAECEAVIKDMCRIIENHFGD